LFPEHYKCGRETTLDHTYQFPGVAQSDTFHIERLSHTLPRLPLVAPCSFIILPVTPLVLLKPHLPVRLGCDFIQADLALPLGG